MKKTPIKLNSDASIDLSTLIETKLAVLANSGGGKSWAIRRIIEQAFGKVQIIVLDPEGEYANLREKYDFILAGKDADAVAEPRTAALLALRLLETEASAIVDLYDLVPQDRKRFVRLFLESIMNVPKNLYHDVLIILDEAHVFAPEKEQSEALMAVTALASQGRKRGFCGIFATQRIAKMSKDVLAECNNKMIGRMTLDVDRKRAADELGLYGKEEILGLRKVKPGQFYAFGPAISDDIIEVEVGDVHVKPPKRGSARSLKTPPPSAKVKAILAELADLPEAAEKEARTAVELKKENATLKGEITRLKAHKPSELDPDAIKKLTDKAYGLGVAAAEHNFKKEREGWKRFKDSLYKRLSPILADIREEATVGIMKDVFDLPSQKTKTYMDLVSFRPQPTRDDAPIKLSRHTDQTDTIAIGKGEMKVLAALAQQEEGMTREHITVATGYKRSTRDAYIARLFGRGYAQVYPDRIVATQSGKDALGSDYTPLPTGPELIRHYLQTLPGGEAKVFEFLVDHGGDTRDAVSMATGFKRSTRDAYLARLISRQLVVAGSGGMVSINPKLQ